MLEKINGSDCLKATPPANSEYKIVAVSENNTIVISMVSGTLNLTDDPKRLQKERTEILRSFTSENHSNAVQNVGNN